MGSSAPKIMVYFRGDTVTDITTGTSAFGTANNYLVLRVKSSNLVAVSGVDEVYVSAYSMTAPVLTVDITEKTPTPSSGDQTPEEIGGSGSGCTTGMSALALAVLGLMVAKRKK